MIALFLLSHRQIRLLYRNPTVAVWYIVLPILLIVIVMPVMKVVVVDSPAQVIPGFTLMFSAFLSTTLAGRIVRDRQSGVWRWFMTTPTSPFIIITAPALAVLSLGVLQTGTALAFGSMFYGLHGVRIGLFAFLAIPIGAGLLLASLTDDLALQANVLNPLALVSSVLGGAVIPLSTQPSWLQFAARFSPHYYGMDSSFLSMVVLLGGGASLSLFAAFRLRKLTWPV